MFFRLLYVLVLLICFCSLESCKQTVHTDSKLADGFIESKNGIDEKQTYPKFEFTKEIHKFGEITEGEIVVCEFYFKNVGDSNLIIRNIESSCGCTVVKWEKKPIKVGEESKITVEFDSKDRHGKQYKVLTIFANTKHKVKELKITAIIK
ncbi:DUF1573 domain-containing protein [Ancylomarina sp. 16SWW S1-10-2]|uniref:DUF1573 domain-containing protein n=1 Tax=Ancylomarina sp. 16SWW S1-10-2 TaxID=2499681 RepID=UPI0012AE90B6|nr:DUF1573 domain-containing protein [Ancylomarina sp. 16SWW S1-10-2]MRT94825.1 DUF1573 domain-containing protein [Ancylomarina sp. 16SWW S1-10-2]